MTFHELVYFLMALAFGVAWVWGVHCIFDDTHLLGKVHAWVEGKIGWKWCKPLFSCPPCMGGFHGAIIFFMFFSVLSWWMLPVFVVCMIGVSYIIKEHLYYEGTAGDDLSKKLDDITKTLNKDV